jgi:hypothetical protein
MEDDERAIRPVTIGELRRRLKDMGEPCTVPARFNDDDPLPDPPRPELGHISCWAGGARAVVIESLPVAALVAVARAGGCWLGRLRSTSTHYGAGEPVN